ncbi:MAG: LPS assembly protein LptD [Pseudomonadota bacterium]
MRGKVSIFATRHKLMVAALCVTCACHSIADDTLELCAPTNFDAPVASQSPLSSDGMIVLESGAGALDKVGNARLSQGVSVQRDSLLLTAEEGSYQRDTGILSLTGDVSYSGTGADIVSQEAILSYVNGQVSFSEAEFQLGNGASRGAASLLAIDRAGTLQLNGVDYTTCPPDQDDWMVRAESILLDTDTGVGSARGLTLRFRDVPILYTPYLSFPISTQRKTGFLLPNFGQSARNGLDISVPWYWNIAPQYDATFTPRVLTRRGIQLDSQLRYLTRRSRGELGLAYLPNDDLERIDRTSVRWQNQTDFAGRWRAFADITDVSDDQYLEDLGGSLSNTSVTHLNRSVGVRYFGEHITGDISATSYQTIDTAITDELEPYRMLPRVRVNADYDDLPWGFETGFRTEWTDFDRDVGVTGKRLHMAPYAGFDWSSGGLYATPRLQWWHTRYDLTEQGQTEKRTATRDLPIASLSAGIRLERELPKAGLRQTLEPHLYFVHVPFRNQSDLPVFDTILPISSLEQLYRENRFIGIDRIGDADQLTVGVRTRLFDANSGRTILAATVGQSRSLSAQEIRLPDSDVPIGNASDYIAELLVNVWGNWNIELAQQWNEQRRETTKSEIRLQYLPGKQRVVNLAYRFRRDSLEQGDLSFSWPLASRWNIVGRYNYSLREDVSLERFIGVEYESCCWGLRLVSRRFISRRDGTSDTAISLQLELKGLTSVGDPADELLERGILGYQSTID